MQQHQFDSPQKMQQKQQQVKNNNNNNEQGLNYQKQELNSPNQQCYSPDLATTNASSLQQSLMKDSYQPFSNNSVQVSQFRFSSQFNSPSQQQQQPNSLNSLFTGSNLNSQSSQSNNLLNINNSNNNNVNKTKNQLNSPSQQVFYPNNQSTTSPYSISSGCPTTASSKFTSPTYKPMPIIQNISGFNQIRNSSDKFDQTNNNNNKVISAQKVSSPIYNSQASSSQSSQIVTVQEKCYTEEQPKHSHNNKKSEEKKVSKTEESQQSNKNNQQNQGINHNHVNSSSSIIQNTQGNINTNNNRNDNSFCSSASRRFSFFSKTSCATGVSQMLGASQFRRTNQSVPRVNITNIIKKRAYLYLDEGLANTFDELLESGYNLVLNKKLERDELRNMEDALKMEVDNVQKEITPLYQELNKTHSQLEYYNDLYQKQIAEHQAMQQEIAMLAEQIANRQNLILQEELALAEQHKQTELEINNVRTQILLNKATHKQERDQFEKSLKTHKIDLDKITEFLSEQKSLFEEKKQNQASRLRKMENKSKMYLGILKH